MSQKVIRLATRRSELAQVQAREVQGLIKKLDQSLEVKLVLTSSYGDDNPELEISEIGGEGAFVNGVRYLLLQGKADIGVHSLKDLPTSKTVFNCISYLKREDPRDALVGLSLKELIDAKGLVLTGSKRREAQLKKICEDLRFGPLRGNIETRLSKVPENGAIMVAYCALKRLSLSNLASYVFEVDEIIPQVGQGIICAEATGEDLFINSILAEINDRDTSICATCERSFLNTLGLGCQNPQGAICIKDGDEIELKAFLAIDDQDMITNSARSSCDSAVQLGCQVAKFFLERIKFF